MPTRVRVKSSDGAAKAGHDYGVVDEIESFVVRSLLERGPEAVFDVAETERVSLLVHPILFFRHHSPWVPLEKRMNILASSFSGGYLEHFKPGHEEKQSESFSGKSDAKDVHVVQVGIHTSVP